MSKKKQPSKLGRAVDRLYGDLMDESRRIFPGEHAISLGWEIETDPDIGDYISATSGYVDILIEDLGEGCGLRARFRAVVVTVHADDATEREFPVPVDAIHFAILENVRMMLEASGISGIRSPRLGVERRVA